RQCPFCTDYQAPSARPHPPDPSMPMPPEQTTGEAPRQIELSGAGDLLMHDDQGRQIGTMNGQMVREIPGASATGVTSDGPNTIEPVYVVPAGLPLSATIDGSTLTTMSPTDLALSGAGYSLAVRGIQLDPGQRDTVTFAATGAGLRYSTTQSESAAIV